MKKIITILMFLTVVCLLVPVYASTAYVSLSTNETSDCTSLVTGDVARWYNAYNYTSSARSVYVNLWNKDGFGTIRKVKYSLYLPGGGGTSAYVTTGTDVQWQLELNPYGILTAGCTANGTLQVP